MFFVTVIGITSSLQVLMSALEELIDLCCLTSFWCRLGGMGNGITGVQQSWLQECFMDCGNGMMGERYQEEEHHGERRTSMCRSLLSKSAQSKEDLLSHCRYRYIERKVTIQKYHPF
jgi:hypothetical protein